MTASKVFFRLVLHNTSALLNAKFRCAKSIELVNWFVRCNCKSLVWLKYFNENRFISAKFLVIIIIRMAIVLMTEKIILTTAFDCECLFRADVKLLT